MLHRYKCILYHDISHSLSEFSRLIMISIKSRLIILLVQSDMVYIVIIPPNQKTFFCLCEKCMVLLFFFYFLFFGLVVKDLFTPKLIDDHLPLMNPDSMATAIKQFSSWTSTNPLSEAKQVNNIISWISFLEGRVFLLLLLFHVALSSFLKRLCPLHLRPWHMKEGRSVTALSVNLFVNLPPW